MALSVQGSPSNLKVMKYKLILSFDAKSVFKLRLNRELEGYYYWFSQSHLGETLTLAKEILKGAEVDECRVSEV